ncbi:MAG: protein kinase [Candidatus Brocadiae bacterium]|nr:protein kinase [Candidatus Brocadiia bacterium]
MKSVEEKIAKLLNKPVGLQVQGKIGTSPLGSVYKIHHPKYGICALKVLEGKVTQNKTFLQKFLQNLEKYKFLKHKNFLQIHEIGEKECFFILREFAYGISLKEKLEAKKLFSIQEIHKILIDLCHALSFANKIGLVHKNIKPANIIIDNAGLLKILDFSLPPTLPYYLSPEQCEGKKSDARSDIYALGILYFHLLAGCLPFAQTSSKEVMFHHSKTPLPDIVKFRSSVTKTISDMLYRMTAKVPSNRYQSYEDLLPLLKKIIMDDMELSRAVTLDISSLSEQDTSGKIVELIQKDREDLIAQKETPSVSKKETKSYTKKLFLLDQSNQSLSFKEIPWDELKKILDQLTNLENFFSKKDIGVTRKSIHFPKIYQNQVIEYLQNKFHRECWLLKEKEGNGEIEIEIDFEQALIFYYLYDFEEKIQESLKKLKSNFEYREELEARKRKAPSKESTQKKGVYDFINTVLEMSQVIDVVLVEQGIEKIKQNSQESAWREACEEQATLIADNEVIQIASENTKMMEMASEKTELLPTDSEKTQAFSLEEEKTVVDSDKILQIAQKSKEETEEFLDSDNQDTVAASQEIANAVRDLKKEKEARDNQVLLAEKDSHEAVSNEVVLAEAEEAKAVNTKRYQKEFQTYLDIEVNFDNRYQTQGWLKFLRENQLQRNVHFSLLGDQEDKSQKKIYRIDLQWLLDYEKKQDNISAIKDFFQSDYEISELGKGGMGIILRLSTRQDATILSLRPENRWAREYFSDILQIRKGQDDTEIVYAEVPAKTSLVVKVAFKGHEESLIQEGKSLEQIAQDKDPTNFVIGMIQQGRLASMNSACNDEHLGYYLMMEYASQGSAEQLYKKFPQGKLSVTVATTVMYGMCEALVKLKEKGIIHRDIKPQNILFNAKLMPKLSDFGLAITTEQMGTALDEERRRLLRLLDTEFLKISREKEQAEAKLIKLQRKHKELQEQNNYENMPALEKEIEEIQSLLPQLCIQEEKRAESLQDRYRLMSAQENALKGQFAGSLFYAAPEQFEAETVLTVQCDVYQLGAVMYTMFTGKKPVEGENLTEVISQVLYHKKPKIKDALPCDPLIEELSELISGMMINDPQSRTPIEEVKHKLNEIIIKYQAELSQEPEERIPDELEEMEAIQEYQNKIQFARKIHRKCLNILPALRGIAQEKFMFTCPQCRKKLHIYKSMAGKQGKCPKCKYPIMVQLPQEQEM